jgi:hypothetical protein
MEDGIENSLSLLIEKELQKIELLQNEIVEKVVKRKRSKDIDVRDYRWNCIHMDTIQHETHTFSDDKYIYPPIEVSKEEKYMEEYLSCVKDSNEIYTKREHLESYDENIEYIDDDADIEIFEEKSEEKTSVKPVYLYDIRGPGELTRNGWIKG